MEFMISTGVSELNNPPNSYIIKSGANPVGLPNIGGNSCIALQQSIDSSSMFNAQIAFGYGGDKLAIRRKDNSNDWSDWKYIDFS